MQTQHRDDSASCSPEWHQAARADHREAHPGREGSEAGNLKPAAYDENSGFVVDLRRFSVVETAKIQTNRAKWFGEEDHFLRICRLRGGTSLLLQKFANLFVRVGLDCVNAHLHRGRNQVGRLFNRTEQYHRLATRCDELAATALTALNERCA